MEMENCVLMKITTIQEWRERNAGKANKQK